MTLKNTSRTVLVCILLGFSQFQSLGQCPLNTPEFPFTTDDDFTLYSWSSNLYMPVQLGGAQTLTNISFRLDNDFSWGNYTYTDVRVYMRNTAVSNFASSPGYPGTAGFTEVYSGSMTFNGTGIYSYNFNVAASFAYNGTGQLEVLFENRGGSDNTSEEPWFDRTNDAGVGVFPGKVGWGSSWSSATGISSNRRFNLQINNVDCPGYPLPVELAVFEPTCDDGKIKLDWETTTEHNNDYFIIERSGDNVLFETVTTVKGKGNSLARSSYSWVDENPLRETAYYRLSQMDYDGKSETFPARSINCQAEENVELFPNPFENQLQLTSMHDGVIYLMDLTGKVVFEHSIRTGNNSLDVSEIESAVYLAKIVLVNGDEKVLKLVKN
ncbi:MAG: hypothetical protein ACJA1C_000132 [Crocinitomicaceae bacterium]|jgi:hypothetical protein